MAAAVRPLDAENVFLFIQRGGIIRPADESYVLGRQTANHRELSRRRGILYLLYLVRIGHERILLLFQYRQTKRRTDPLRSHRLQSLSNSDGRTRRMKYSSQLF